ncbi:taste receptor type 2 member 39-like [Leptodactylus fuscus]|uniref:taste receptor type 2 member 39-like n=1 Tax=Leptodactylus fuscus TaxID=238119 RepID=UPI003F4E5E0C
MLYKICNIITCILIAFGLLLNGFIVMVNFYWWIKRQTLQSIHVLITSLALVRLALLSLCTFSVFLSVSHISFLQVNAFPAYIATAVACMVFCSLCWGSVLCVFYCVKITNYSNRLFMRLKMNISKMVPWLLLISLVISFLTSLLCSQIVFSSCVLNGTLYGNETMEVNAVNLALIVSGGSIVPFMICGVAIYLITMSLMRHTRNMSSGDSSFSDAQRDVHLSVIRSMVSFLIFYTLHLVALIVIIIIIDADIPALSFTCFICIYAYPSLHSISFITTNKELQNVTLAVLCCDWLGNLKKQNP